MVHDALVAGGTEDGGLVDSLVCDGIVAGIGAISLGGPSAIARRYSASRFPPVD